jgi:hypothetical protein
MIARLTPKAELQMTLDKMWDLIKDPSPVNIAQLRGLLDHARAVAKRVGHEARPERKPKKDAGLKAVTA